MVGSLNDWQKERQFKTLNEKKEERGVKVIRDGVEKVIDIKVRCIFFFRPRIILPSFFPIFTISTASRRRRYRAFGTR